MAHKPDAKVWDTASDAVHEKALIRTSWPGDEGQAYTDMQSERMQLHLRGKAIREKLESEQNEREAEDGDS